MPNQELGKYFLLSASLFNPAITYLLFESILFSAILFLGSILIIILLSKLHKLLLVYGINFLLLISFFLYAELIFRFGFTEYVINNFYQIENGYYFNKPNLVEHIEDKEYKVLYKTNQNGYRIPSSLDASQTVNECDWLFIGDSFTQGAQVEFKNLYTSQLYRKFPDKVIINSGISGFGVIEEYNYFKNAGYKLKPKKVFLQICSFNDFMNINEKNNKLSDYLIQFSDFARFLLFNIKFKSPEELPLGRWTEPFCLRKEDNENYNIFYKDKSDKQLEDLKKFNKYLALFKQEVEKHGGELIVFLIPTKEQTYQSYLNEVLTSFKIPEDKLNMSFPNSFTEQICNKLGIQLIDLLDKYKNSSENVFFEFDEHLNEHGHYITAEGIFDSIQKYKKDKVEILSKNFLGERYPSYSNDENFILYQGQRDGNMELFLNNKDMDSEIWLTDNNINETHPILNPKKNIIAFTEGNADEFTTNIVLLNLNNKERTTLTKEVNTFGAIPMFSLDGDFIVYPEWKWDDEIQNFTSPNIVICPIDSIDFKTQLTNDEFENWRPIFTPDNKSIIFISKRDGQFDIIKKEIESGKETQLTDTSFDEWDPQISNEGNQLVYAAHKNDNWDLYTLDLEYNKSQKITETLGNEWDPYFSNDGKRILFAGEFGFFHCIHELILE